MDLNWVVVFYLKKTLYQSKALCLVIKLSLQFKLKNLSNVKVLYRTILKAAEDNGLFSGLSFKVNERDFSGIISYKSNWQDLAATDQPENITFEIELPGDAGNEYQDLSTSIVLVVEAIQGNAEVTGGEEILRRYNRICC